MNPRARSVATTRVEKEVEAPRANPGRHVDFKLRRRLLRHHYFRDRFGSGEFEPDFSYPPFVLYVQKPKGEGTGTSPEDVARYGEWLGSSSRCSVAPSPRACFVFSWPPLDGYVPRPEPRSASSRPPVLSPCLLGQEAAWFAPRTRRLV